MKTVDHPAHYNAHPSGIEYIDVISHILKGIPCYNEKSPELEGVSDSVSGIAVGSLT